VIIKRLVLSGLVSVMSLCTWAIGTAAQAPGEPVYAKHCSRCHGPEGRGIGTLGPNLIPFEMSYEKALEQIRRPLCDMPPFEEAELSDADVAQIVAYLKSIKEPRQAVHQR